MNTELIRRLADEAAKFSAVMALPTGESGDNLFVEKFAELIAAEERDACAKVCEEKKSSYEERASRPEKLRNIKPEVALIAGMTCDFIADAIRTRGNE